MEEIIVQINPQERTCRIETEGFSGDDCLSIQTLKEAIGQEVWREMKPEARSSKVRSSQKVVGQR